MPAGLRLFTQTSAIAYSPNYHISHCSTHERKKKVRYSKYAKIKCKRLSEPFGTTALAANLSVRDHPQPLNKHL